MCVFCMFLCSTVVMYVCFLYVFMFYCCNVCVFFVCFMLYCCNLCMLFVCFMLTVVI